MGQNGECINYQDLDQFLELVKPLRKLTHTNLILILESLSKIRPVLYFQESNFSLEERGLLHYLNTSNTEVPNYFRFAFNTQTDIYGPQEIAEGIQEYAQIRTYHPFLKSVPGLFRVIHGHVVAQLPLEDLMENRVVAYRPKLNKLNSYNYVSLNPNFWWTTTVLYEKVLEHKKE